MRRTGILTATAALLALAAPASAEGLKLLSISTLLGEIITFAILVYVVKKFVWPPLMKAVEDRQKEIADGLAAAEQGRQELESAQSRKDEMLKDARAKASAVIAEGEKRRAEIVESAKAEAEAEAERILEQGRRNLEMERSAMRRELVQEVGALALAGATRIVEREADAAAHEDIIKSLKKDLS